MRRETSFEFTVATLFMTLVIHVGVRGYYVIPLPCLPHLKVDRQVPLQGDLIHQADLRLAGISAFLSFPFFLWALEKRTMEENERTKWELSP